MEEIADAIHAHEAKQPHGQQNEPDFEEHLASHAPPDARKTLFRRGAVRSSANEGMWLDVKDHVRTVGAPVLVEQNRDPATNVDRSAAQQLTSSSHVTTQDGGPTIRQPAADPAAPFVFRARPSISRTVDTAAAASRRLEPQLAILVTDQKMSSTPHMWCFGTHQPAFGCLLMRIRQSPDLTQRG